MSTSASLRQTIVCMMVVCHTSRQARLVPHQPCPGCDTPTMEIFIHAFTCLFVGRGRLQINGQRSNGGVGCLVPGSWPARTVHAVRHRDTTFATPAWPLAARCFARCMRSPMLCFASREGCEGAGINGIETSTKRRAHFLWGYCTNVVRTRTRCSESRVADCHSGATFGPKASFCARTWLNSVMLSLA